MKLLTKELLAEFEKQGDTSSKSADEIRVICKFFLPDSNFSWFITDYLKDEDIFFGYCLLNNPEMSELGYVSRQELSELRGCLGLPAERDLGWDSNTKLQTVIDKKGLL